MSTEREVCYACLCAANEFNVVVVSIYAADTWMECIWLDMKIYDDTHRRYHLLQYELCATCEHCLSVCVRVFVLVWLCPVLLLCENVRREKARLIDSVLGACGVANSGWNLLRHARELLLAKQCCYMHKQFAVSTNEIATAIAPKQNVLPQNRIRYIAL